LPAGGGVAERDYAAQASAGIEALQPWYRPFTGRWRGAGWWNAANALTAVIAYIQYTGDQRYLGNARSIWDNNKNLKNEFGLHWAGPFDRADACRQSSAMDALNAAAALAAEA
jgi:hypothetical protein